MTTNPGPLIQVLATTEPDGRWSQVALELLGDARSLADRCAGRVGAWTLSSGNAKPGGDDTTLARHGADLVFRLTHPRLAGWSSEAIAAALAANLSAECRLILLPGHSRGEELAALLAARLETAWIHSALSLAATRQGAIEVTSLAESGRLSRTNRVAGERPAVVTMSPGVGEVRQREPTAPVELVEPEVDLSHIPELTRIEGFLPADPHTMDLRHARRIVAAGRGAGGPDGVELVRRLAEALGASLGASRMAVDMGWVAAERQIGQTGRTVRPDLYVACGISGASHHLAGIRESRTIVALNPDAAAPIHELAHLSLLGDLHEVIPAIVDSLARRRAAAPPDSPR